MADISVTINPPNQIDLSVGEGITKHAPTHAPGGSDSLSAYYVTGDVIRPSETGSFLTSGQTGAFTGVFYPYASNPNGYVQGAVVRPSNTGAFLDTGSSQTINSLKNFLIRPTVSGVGVLLIGEGGAASTGALTGAFYPLNSNPSGYITGVDLSNYVTKSSTGSFVTTGQTGNFVVSTQTGAFLTTGAADSRYALQSQTGTFITTGQTGNFISSSQTGQFVSTGSTGNFVTGSVVRPNDTGLFITTSQTGAFYPISNPSGFITGVDLTNYVTKSATGSFVTTGQTGNFITNTQTGQFVNTGSTGSFITASQTGAFYPISNPSGYITGVDLSNYVTQSSTGSFVTTGQTGSFVTGSVVRPSETGAFITTGQTGNFATNDKIVLLTGDQTISGIKSFISRPTVGGTGVLLSGEATAVNTGSLTGVFYPLNSNPSGYITGVDLSNYIISSQTGQFVSTGATGNFLTNQEVVLLTGNQNISGIKNFTSRPTVNGIQVLLSGEGSGGGAVNTGELTGAFYPLNSNPSGYITGVDLSNYVTGSVVRPSETGNFITTAQTGAFYPASNPSGFITGVDLSSYATTSYVTGVSGDLQNKIDTTSGYAVTGYNDAIIAISVAGGLTKTITLLQRDGSSLSGSFTDASGEFLQNVVYTTGDQNISGEKRFYNEAFFESGVHLSGKLTFNTGFLSEVFDGEASWNNEYGTLQIGMNNGDVVNPVGFKNFYRVKANASIAKGKVVMAVGTVGNSEFILAQEAANIGSSGELIMGVAAEAITAGNFGDVVSFGAVKGINTSLFNSGAILYFDPASTGGFTQTPPSPPNAKVITALNLDPSSNGTVFVRVDPGSVLGGSDSNVKFTALQNNDFISYHAASGFWRNKTLTTGDVSGISAYALAADTGSFITTAQTGQFVSTGATGSFVVSSQTGAFLTTGAADGRYALQSATGAFITSGQTGAFAASALTGAFLTTGAADALYYTLSNGQSISGFATTGFNDAITGMTITGDTTKVITLFQRDGTTVTGSFIDNAGTGGGGGSGASVTISTSPPVSPSDGSLWFNSESGILYIYYDDGNSQQWVASDNNGIGLNPVTFDASASGIFSISGQQISGVDPNADCILFWDDSESKLAHLSVGSGLSVSGTTLSIAATGLPSVIQVACSDESTALTAGAGKVTFRMPYAMNLTEVRSNVVVAPSGSALIVDINQAGVSILSTKLSIDAGEKTSVTAATPAVISGSSLGDDNEITIDIDQIGSSVAGAGLKITFLGIRE